MLRYSLDDSEKFKTDLDFGLVKAFLKSAQGGGLAGVHYGIKSIPKRWLKGIQAADKIKKETIPFVNEICSRTLA